MNEKINDTALKETVATEGGGKTKNDDLREQKRETRYLVYLCIGLFFLALALFYLPTVWASISRSGDVTFFVFAAVLAIAINFLYRAHKENPHKPPKSPSTFDEPEKKPQG